jgi:hypothetical protein
MDTSIILLTFVLIVFIIISVISYIYYPVIYVGLTALFAVIIGLIVIYINRGINWILFILVCNIFASIYLKSNQYIITLWITSLGLYTLLLYLLEIGNKEYTKYPIVNKIFICLLIIGLYIVATWTITQPKGIYIIWSILTLYILLYAYLNNLYEASIINLGILVAIVSIVLFYIMYLYITSIPKPKNIVVENPIPIDKYSVLLTSSKMDEIRPNQYRYNIQFSVWLVPYLGTNKDYSILTIDNNIELRYNSVTGILSLWAIPLNETTFIMLYGNYYAPLQTWLPFIINILDGKLDFFINSHLKFSTNIIPTQLYLTNAITIGSKENNIMKGYIKNIMVYNDIYIP